jgi:hypothetical protein
LIIVYSVCTYFAVFQIGWKHLKDDINLMGAENGFTRLVWPLAGEDPDDAFSSVPYEKVGQCD